MFVTDLYVNLIMGDRNFVWWLLERKLEEMMKLVIAHYLHVLCSVT